MLECKILCIPHSEGPTGLIHCEPLVVSLLSVVEEASGESVQGWVRGRWKVVENQTLKPHLLFQHPLFLICPSLSPSLLLGKQRFMVRLGEMVQRYPYKLNVLDCGVLTELIAH